MSLSATTKTVSSMGAAAAPSRFTAVAATVVEAVDRAVASPLVRGAALLSVIILLLVRPSLAAALSAAVAAAAVFLSAAVWGCFSGVFVVVAPAAALCRGIPADAVARTTFTLCGCAMGRSHVLLTAVPPAGTSLGPACVLLLLCVASVWRGVDCAAASTRCRPSHGVV